MKTNLMKTDPSKTKQVRPEIALLGTVIACVLALLIATIGTAAGAAIGEEAARQETQSPVGKTYEGMVTCSRCGARHSAALGQTAADCARICVRGGASFLLVEADATYLLDGDLSLLGKLAGQRARIVGELNGKTIKISSVISES